MDAIQLGIQRIKGAGTAGEIITEDTCFWLAEVDERSIDFDSLDLLDLILFLEEEFGWVIPEEEIDAENWRTVGNLITIILQIVNDHEIGPRN